MFSRSPWASAALRLALAQGERLNALLRLRIIDFAIAVSYHFSMELFRDKAILITGASSGIGKETALRLASYGARLGLASRNRDALEDVRAAIVKIGGQAVVLPTDVTVADQVRDAVDGTVQAFGKLDILISSAGLSMRAYFECSQLDAMERVMRVNFFGTLYATHFALPHIIKTKGSMVGLSSMTGQRGIPSYSIYGASKFAVQGFYDALRLEVARHGVHVGVLAPAFVDTPLRDNVLGPDGKPWDVQPPPPFRIWPVAKCVDYLVHLIVKRKRKALLPRFTGPLLVIDEITGRWIGDRIVKRRFPPEGNMK